MLVLSRLVNEGIVLILPDGRRARIVVCEVRGAKVRLGIDAPEDVTVRRDEIQELIDSGWNAP